ncbi:hypothetical protein HFO56_02520 [Rhizobium laguerreae]|uniref:hypothetical protein n=1 Tax=Rhizobium laguerreae TaxID=1076926 RepID=UPI001C8FCDDB|nr:hypothetical protein [Rhizobium laguerreae]MBY3151259.1 hypothetical protein [Rhizobium laguerreae]
MSFDFNGMEDLKKRTGRGGGFTASHNLPFRIHEINLANPKAATRGVDTVDGYLLKPAFGKEAGGLVTIKIKDRGAPTDPDKTPMEVFDLQIGRKKGSGGKMGQHAAVIAEDARVLQDGTIECNWVKVVEHEFKEAPEAEWLHTGFISVGYLNAPTDKGFIRQDRFVHFVEEARTISGAGDEAVAGFRDLVSKFLTERTSQAGGRPSAVIRLVNQNNAGQAGSVATATIWLGWDKEKSAFLTPEESVDRWLASEEAEKWLNFVRHADQIAASNGVLEVWPVWSFTTAKKTAERETKLKNAGKMHLQEQFTAPMINEAGEPVLNDNGKRRNHFGLIADGMHQVVQMQGGVDWFANQTWTFDRFPTKLFSIDDLPTANLSPEVVKVFEANGAKRVEDKRLARNVENDAAPEQQQEQEQGQDFGSDNTPDPAGGQFRPR